MSFSDSQGLEGPYGAPFARSVLGASVFTGFGTIIFFVLDGTAHFDLLAFLMIGLIAFAFATVVIGLAAGLVGLPLTWLFERLGLERPWTYPLSGLVIGGAFVAVLPILLGEGRGSEAVLELLPFPG